MPAILMSGAPLKVKLEIVQFAGVMVIFAVNDPVPELSSMPWMFPETDTVPPPGQATLADNGKLQLWPVAVTVHAGD